MLQKQNTVSLLLDADFARWAALTDAYAEQLAAMARGEPEARVAAARLAEAVEEMSGENPLEVRESLWLTVS